MCSLCFKHAESSFHLFCQCQFAVNLWSWFASILNTTLQFTSFEDIWHICDRNWSPQCKIVIKACIINLFSTIWYCRNQARFNNRVVHWRSAINLIISNVHLSGSKTNKSASPDIREFMILKLFKIDIHPPKAPDIKEVIWCPPLISWVKVNTDGAATKNPQNASAGGIFRDHTGLCLGCFSQNLGPLNAFTAELIAAMLAIENAHRLNITRLWLETDSQLVAQAFNSSLMVPWSLKNRWLNCLASLRHM